MNMRMEIRDYNSDHKINPNDFHQMDIDTSKRIIVLFGPDITKLRILEIMFFFRDICYEAYSMMITSPNMRNDAYKDMFDMDTIKEFVATKFKEVFPLMQLEVPFQRFIRYYYDEDKDYWMEISIPHNDMFQYYFTNDDYIHISFSSAFEEWFHQALEEIHKDATVQKSYLNGVKDFWRTIETDFNSTYIPNMRRVSLDFISIFEDYGFNNNSIPAIINRIYGNIFGKDFYAKFHQRMAFGTELFHSLKSDYATRDIFDKINKSTTSRLDMESVIENMVHGRRVPHDSAFRNIIPIAEILDPYWYSNSSKNYAFFIEEPEQGLYPTEQNLLVDWLAWFSHSNTNSQLVLATNSPYILTRCNLLLYAGQFDKSSNPFVHSKYHIEEGDLVAYMFENDESEDMMEDNLIRATEIDKASDDTNDLMDEILDYHIDNVENKRFKNSWEE